MVWRRSKRPYLWITRDGRRKSRRAVYSLGEIGVVPACFLMRMRVTKCVTTSNEATKSIRMKTHRTYSASGKVFTISPCLYCTYSSLDGQ